MSDVSMSVVSTPPRAGYPLTTEPPTFSPDSDGALAAKAETPDAWGQAVKIKLSPEAQALQQAPIAATQTLYPGPQMPPLPPEVADLGEVVVNAMRLDYSNLWLSLTNNGTTPNPPNNQGQLMMQLNTFYSGQIGAATTAKNYVATHLTIDPNLDLNNIDVKEALRAVKDGLEATAYRALLRPLDKANGPGLTDLTGSQVWDSLQRTDIVFSATGPANPIPSARPGTQAGRYLTMETGSK